MAAQRAKGPQLAKPRCQVCKHPDRLRIEMARISGASLSAVADKFGISRDSVWRHMEHVDPDRRAMLIADVPVAELAARAVSEDVSLLDYYSIVRKTVMDQLLGAASCNDRHATAMLAGRATETLTAIGKLTGEILRTTPGLTVNNTYSTTVFMQSQTFILFERMLIAKLQPHPDALRDVLEGLSEFEAASAPETAALPALAGPSEAQHAP